MPFPKRESLAGCVLSVLGLRCDGPPVDRMIVKTRLTLGFFFDFSTENRKKRERLWGWRSSFDLHRQAMELRWWRFGVRWFFRSPMRLWFFENCASSLFTEETDGAPTMGSSAMVLPDSSSYMHITGIERFNLFCVYNKFLDLTIFLGCFSSIHHRSFSSINYWRFSFAACMFIFFSSSLNVYTILHISG